MENRVLISFFRVLWFYFCGEVELRQIQTYRRDPMRTVAGRRPLWGWGGSLKLSLRGLPVSSPFSAFCRQKLRARTRSSPTMFT